MSATAPLFGKSYLEGNIGYLRSTTVADRLGGTLRLIFPVSNKAADVLDALSHDAELLASEQSAVAISGENLSLTRESYRAGNTGVLQVLEAQRQSQQARLGLVRAQAQRYEDTVDLLLALALDTL